MLTVSPIQQPSPRLNEDCANFLKIGVQLLNHISKMFKQAKKAQSCGSQSSISLGRTIKGTQSLPKEVLEFMSRQLSVLKDIADSSCQTHPDIITSRLHQCIHLMEKKLWYSLGENPEQYHDYIQDFYENQLNSLRSELNICKIQAANKKRELEQLRTANEILLKQKQQQVSTLQTSRVSKTDAVLEYCDQNSKLRKELDHCRMLLLENTQLIEEQAKAMDSLMSQLKTKDKEHKLLRDQYDGKIIQFDEYISKCKTQFESQMRNLANEQKNYQSQLKQISITRIRVLEERSNLEKELETKIEEIQLLTKKILDDEMVITKYQRTIAMKQKLIDDLYLEIDSANGSLSRFGKKEGDYQKACSQKNQQIIKLEQRIRVAHSANQKLEKKVAQFSTKMEEIELENTRFETEIQSWKEVATRLESESEILRRKLEQSEKTCSKLGKQKEKSENETKIMEERYNDLFERSKEEKLLVKKQILTEVNELVELIRKKEDQVKVSCEENRRLVAELDREKSYRAETQCSLDKLNGLMSEVERKMKFLQGENSSLAEAKEILETEIEKMSKQLMRLERVESQYESVLADRKRLAEQLANVRREECSVGVSQNCVEESRSKKEEELEQALAEQRKQKKEIGNRRDFEIKQLESKVRILQQQLRESSKQFENEKFKMSLKIKELEELLKERYDFSSRFSQQSDGQV